MISKYNEKITNILSKGTSENWAVLLEEHLYQISIIQHERLIHLLVTIFVGLVMTMCVLVTIITKMTLLLLLDFPLILLFTVYIFHYRYLENTTQKWYVLTEKIKNNLN